MRTTQSSSDPRRGCFTAGAHRAPTISGELLNDEFSSYPPDQTASLSPAVLHYWGLFASPFALALTEIPLGTEFYFRSESHVAAWAWLQNLVRRPPCLGMLTASSGAGATTLLRHLATSSGLGGTAVEIVTLTWVDQTLTQFTQELSQASGVIDSSGSVRTVWLVDVAPACNIGSGVQLATALANWFQSLASAPSNLTIVTIVRKSVDHVRLVSDATRFIPTHYLRRCGNHELVRCIGASLHHAGGTRPAFTVAATQRLAEAAKGSIDKLGRLVHTALLHGYVTGLRQVTRNDLAGRIDDRSINAVPADLNRAA